MMSVSNEVALEDLVNLDRYPINCLEDEKCISIINDCKAALTKDGFCVLPEFLSSKGITELLKESKRNFSKAKLNGNVCNVWNEDPNDLDDNKKYSTKHLRRKTSVSHCAIITSDIIGTASLLRRIHTWSSFLAFASHVAPSAAANHNAPADAAATPPTPPPLHPLTDELGARTVRIVGEGHRLSWRFVPHALEATLVLRIRSVRKQQHHNDALIRFFLAQRFVCPDPVPGLCIKSPRALSPGQRDGWPSEACVFRYGGRIPLCQFG